EPARAMLWPLAPQPREHAVLEPGRRLVLRCQDEQPIGRARQCGELARAIGAARQVVERARPLLTAEDAEGKLGKQLPRFLTTLVHRPPSVTNLEAWSSRRGSSSSRCRAGCSRSRRSHAPSGRRTPRARARAADPPAALAA